MNAIVHTPRRPAREHLRLATTHLKDALREGTRASAIALNEQRQRFAQRVLANAQSRLSQLR